MEQNEEYLNHVTNEEKAIIEKILNKQMEANLTNMFEDDRHERSLILLLSLTDPHTLKNKFTDDETNIMKSLALEKLHRHKCLEEYVALQILK